MQDFDLNGRVSMCPDDAGIGNTRAPLLSAEGGGEVWAEDSEEAHLPGNHYLPPPPSLHHEGVHRL